MNLKAYREKKGMTRAQMVRALEPHMRGLSVDEFFLERFERGEASADRQNVILAAASKAFPDFAPPPDQVMQRRVRLPTIRSALLLALIVFLGTSGYAFWVHRDNPTIDDIDQYVGMIAGLGSIVALVIAIVRLRSK